jgi:chemotaxis protein MotB
VSATAARRGPGLRHGAGHDEEHEQHENHERWLVSYADMMTLLMVLFIVMFAISQVDQKKFLALKTGLTVGFGQPVAIMPGGEAMLDPGGAVAPDSVNLAGAKGNVVTGPFAKPALGVDPAAVAKLADVTEREQAARELKNLLKARDQLKAALAKAGVPNGATFRIDERGLVITIATDKVLFDSASARLRPEGRRILDAIEPTLSGLPNDLSVDGHTNSLPISTPRFPSNWELSSDRATGVLRYLARPGRIPASRMSATGYADTRPLLPPSDPGALVANRRVEIVVLARFDSPQGRGLVSGAEAAAAQAGFGHGGGRDRG